MALSQIQLEAFQEVARLGSFTKAASVLGLTQSALSHRIKNLEDDLETTLFVRQGSGVRLTELGAKLLRYCRVQFQAQEEFEEEFLAELKFGQGRAGLSGTLRIGAVSSLMRSIVMPSLGALIRGNPGIRVELFVQEVGEMQRLISSGQADLLVTSGQLSMPGLSEALLGHEEYVLIESLKNGRNGKKTATDIFLDHDSEDQTTYDFFKAQGQKKTLRRSFLDDIYGLLDGVAAGWGRAVMPLHLVATRKDVSIVKGHKPLRVPVYLYQLKQPYYSKLHAAAVQELISGVSSALSAADDFFEQNRL